MRRPIEWLMRRGGGLKERTLRGGTWTVLGRVGGQVLNLAKQAIVARLLFPRDFGLMGIAVAVLRWLDQFTETGFGAALVRKPEDIRPYLDTAFTVQLLRCVTVATLILAGAPLVGHFFAAPAAVPVVRAVSLVVLFRGLASPAVVYFQRELDFRRDTSWRLSGEVAGALVAVPLALFYRNVWALAISMVVAEAVRTAATYWIAPYRPRLRIDWAQARELARFGKWIFWLNVLNYLVLYLDTVSVGRFLGPTALGYYQMANQLALLPTAGLVVLLNVVMYPAFARVSGLPHLRRAFLRTLSIINALVLPVGCFLAVFAEPLVKVVLGGRWAPAIPVLRVVAAAGVAAALSATATPLFKALGRPSRAVAGLLMRLVIMGALLWLLIPRLGMKGAAWAFTISSMASMAYQLLVAKRLVKASAYELLNSLRLGALASIPFLLAGLVVAPRLSPMLILALVAALCTYALVLLRAFESELGTLFGMSFSVLARRSRSAGAPGGVKAS